MRCSEYLTQEEYLQQEGIKVQDPIRSDGSFHGYAFYSPYLPTLLSMLQLLRSLQLSAASMLGGSSCLRYLLLSWQSSCMQPAG